MKNRLLKDALRFLVEGWRRVCWGGGGGRGGEREAGC